MSGAVFSQDNTMIYTALKTVHLLSIIVWFGGMVFMHFFLHPSAAQLDAPVRLRLMCAVLSRYFRAVLVASLLALASGVWMLGRVAKQAVQSGAGFEMPVAWTVMAVLGAGMVIVLLYIRFVLYRRLLTAVAASDGSAADAALAQTRKWSALNLGLGLVVILVTLLR